MFRRALLPLGIAIVLFMVASIVVPGLPVPSLVPADADTVTQREQGMSVRVDAPSDDDGVAQTDPTEAPTEAPSDPPPPEEPTAEPTEAVETEEPTEESTAEPTEAVETEAPTEESTAEPTEAVETEEPTEAPTTEPTQTPTPTETPDATPETPAPTEEPGDNTIIDPEGDTNNAGAACQFSITDNGDSNPFTFNFSVDSSQTFGIDNYSWAFGDSQTSTAQNPGTITYPGTTGVTNYTVTLVCNATTGNPITLQGGVVIDYQPSAAFFVSPTTAIAPVTVVTNNFSFGIGLTYAWTVTRVSDGGIEATSTAAEPTFTFTSEDTYNISLAVTDTFGNVRNAGPTAVVVGPPPPDITMQISPGTGDVGTVFTVSITNAADAGTATTLNFSYTDSPTILTSEPTTIAPGATETFTLEYSAIPADNEGGVTLNYSNASGGGTVSRSVGLFPTGVSLSATFQEVSRRNVSPGIIEICLENTSGGPWETAEWDFEYDGTLPLDVDLVDGSRIVCFQRPSGSSRLIALRISTASGADSVFADNISGAAPPVAVIDGAASVVWDGSITFNANNSTGQINVNGYDWDLDGDGTFELIGVGDGNQTLSNVRGELGARTVRLRVTGTINGIDYVSVAEATFQVRARDINCTINGPTGEVVGNNSADYTVNIGQRRGRDPITYSWTVTGPSGAVQTGTGSTLTVDWTSLPEATYTVDVVVTVDADDEATTSEVVTCNDTIQVENDFVLPVCSLSANTVGGRNGFNPLPDDSLTYTYTAAIDSGLAGRTITDVQFFYSDNGGNIQILPMTPSASTTLDRVFSDNDDGTTDTLQALITLSDGTTCLTPRPTAQDIVIEWDTFSCTESGDFNPIPTMPDQVRAYTYTITWSGDNDLDLDFGASTFNLVDSSNNVVASAVSGDVDNTNNTITLTFNGWDFNDDGQNYRIEWNLVTADPADLDGTNREGDCNGTRNINVSVPNPSCRAITGDLAPVIGETVTYNFLGVQTEGTGAAGTHYGRTPTFSFEFARSTDSGSTYTDVLNTGGVDNFTFTFNDPDEFYRLRFTANLTDPTQSCPETIFIGTPSVGEDFTCIDWTGSDNGANRNIFQGSFGGADGTIQDSQNYDFQVEVDNTNNYPLDYTLRINGSDVATQNDNTIDVDTGPVTFTLTSTDFPVPGVYPIEIFVREIGQANTPYECTFTETIVVGLIDVLFSSNQGTPSAIEQGTEICLTNDSTTSNWGGTPSEFLTYEYVFNTENVTFVSTPPGSVSVGGGNTTISGLASTDTLPCFTLPVTDGVTYSITLTGIDATGRSDSDTDTFTIYGSQELSLGPIPGNIFEGDPVNFTQISQNIDSYQWRIYNQDTGAQVGGVGTGTSLSRTFNTPGNYRVEVIGTGNLGNNTAQALFTVYSFSSIQASFDQTTYSGIAPLEVCFTDTSFPDSINSWEWDFDDDGTPEITFNDSTYQQVVCNTYTAVGSYRVRLTVSDGNNSAQASNIVSVIPLAARDALFTITPGGGVCASSEFQFTPVDIETGSPLDPLDFEVFGWDFDTNDVVTPFPGSILDFGAGFNNGSQCFGYAISATYLVCMDIRDPTGSFPNIPPICRPVTVTGTPPSPPTFDASATCTAGLTGSFTIENTSANDMTTPDRLTITDNAGVILVQIDTFQLDAGATQTFNFTPTAQGALTLNLLDNNVTIVSSGGGICPEPPQVTVTPTCSGTPQQVLFTIDRVGDLSPAQQAQAWEVVDGSGNSLSPAQTGTFGAGFGANLSFGVTVPNPYGPYRFVSTGPLGDFDIGPQTCNPQPTITATGLCTVGSGLGFQLENTSGNNMVQDQSYEIVDGSGISLSPAQTGTFNLAAGTTQDIYLPPGTFDPYQTYRFVTADFAATIDQSHSCTAPNITVEAPSTCTNTPVVFTVRNTGGGQMLVPQNFRITENGTDLTTSDYTPSTASFRLDANGTQAFTISGSPNPSNAFSFIIDDGSGYIPNLTSSNPCQPSVLRIEPGTCDSPLSFTIFNDGPGDMAQNETVAVSGGVSFTISGAGRVDDTTINIANGASATVTLDSAADPYVAYTVTVSGGVAVGEKSDTISCTAPVITASANSCSSTDPSVQFTVTNTSGSDPMALPQNFRIVDSSNASVAFTPNVSSFDLAGGASQTFTVTNADPYESYTLIADDASGFLGFDTTALSENKNCLEPSLTVSVTDCTNAAVVFTVTNQNANPMLVAQNFTISRNSVDLNTSDYTPSNASFRLDGNGSTTFTVNNTDPYAAYVFTANDNSGFLDFDVTALTTSRDCVDPQVSVSVTTCDTAVVAFTVSNIGGAMLIPQDFTITRDSVALTTADYTPSDSTFQLAATGQPNDLQTFTIPGDPYANYVFTADGVAGFISALNAGRDCADPTLRIESTCGDPLVFTITNDGPGIMLEDETVEITDGVPSPVSFALSGNGVQNTTDFRLAVGETLTVTLDSTVDPYALYMLNITNGFARGESMDMIDCDDPNLEIIGTCATTSTFTITNNGTGPMLEAETVTVLDQSNNPVAFTLSSAGTGVVNATDISIPAGESVTVTLDGTVNDSLDPYARYDISLSNTDGGTGGFSLGEDADFIDCDDPSLEIISTCATTLTFTITNNGTGDMLETETVALVDTGSNPVAFTLSSTGSGVISATEISIPAGESVTVTLDGTVDDSINPYARYDITISGSTFTPGEKTDFIDCVDPALTIVGTCGDPLVFTINNSGGAMLETETVSVVDSNSDPVSFTLSGTGFTNPNQISIPASSSVLVTLNSTINPYARYDITISGSTFTPGEKADFIDCDDPALVISSTCGDPLTFTITNNGGDMLEAEDVRVETGDTVGAGSVVGLSPSTINLTAGETQIITLDAGLDPYDPYIMSLSSTDGGAGGYAPGDDSAAIDCLDPTLSIETICGDPLQFRITNNGPGEMLESESVSVTGASGAISIDTTSILLAAGQSATVTLDDTINPYAAYDLNISGFARGTKSAQIDCDDPVLRIESTCGEPLIFTIFNDGGPMLEAEEMSATGPEGSISISPTSIEITNGGSQVITLDAALDPYAAYTLTVDTGFSTGERTQTIDCPDPILSVNGACVYQRTFTVTNAGGNMLEPQEYEILDQGGTVVQSGTFDVDSSEVFTLDGLDPYVPYTFRSSGFAGGLDFTLDCQDPDIVVRSECVFPIAFTVTNNGPGAMLLPQSFSITNASGGAVLTGTYELGAGESTVFTLDGLDPYAAYTFNTSGFAGDFTLVNDCEDPFLTIASQCAFPVTFTLRNVGAMMLTEQSFSITDEAGAGVVFNPSQSTFDLGSGGEITFRLDGLDPYAAYTFTSSGFAGSLSLTNDCVDPTIVVESTCGPEVLLTISNVGGAMLTDQGFSIGSEEGPVPTIPATQTFLLGPNQNTNFTLVSENPYLEYNFVTDGFAARQSVEIDCEDPILVVSASCDVPLTFEVSNFGGDMYLPNTVSVTDEDGETLDVTPTTFELLAGFSTTITAPDVVPSGEYNFRATGVEGTFTEVVSCDPTSVADGGRGGRFTIEDLPPSINEPGCGFGCPTFHVYHTDETGEWEIFRLDGADPQNRQTFRVNLTQGNGTNINGDLVDDVAPSRSPNAEWIAFSSNRDGNWEIYITPTDGDASQAQRVTFNEIAIDTDPVWGPNNFIVYESTRNGNWDLYAVDVETGIEYQLTADDADDINPFWSPDGSKVIFQSERDGDTWQIYELSLATRELRLLSDGSGADVDPQYNNTGDRILFRSYRDGADSVMYLMDANGENPVAITGVDEDATNGAWSPNDNLIAFQSDLDGDLDVYVYEVATGERRQLTDNDIADYAPTWICDNTRVIFTSDIEGNPDIFSAEALPIEAAALLLLEDEEAQQLTFEAFLDVYPQDTPAEENASREGRTSLGEFGEQTIFIEPEVENTEIDITFTGVDAEEWREVDSCQR